MQPLDKFAKEHGFDNTTITRSELEDGIGACVGKNYTKDGVFYTPDQMAKAVGHSIKFTNAKMKGNSRQDVEAQLVKQMEASNVIAAQITKCREFAPGMFFVNVEYIK